MHGRLRIEKTLDVLRAELEVERSAKTELTRRAAWLAFMRFARQRFATAPTPDSDGLLFQYGTYAFSGRPVFTVDLARQLQADVSDTLRALGPQARELLIIGALEGEFPADATDDLRDQQSTALVHTSYFSHKSVLHLIATHIRISRARAGYNTAGPLSRDDAYQWVCRTKKANAHAWQHHLRQTARPAQTR
ncbi:hypothetical protein [Streptomyces sp. NPDC051452]|uniref:hypothetical protein n=1 Tax=Streptomyces sp. NPDC051452 TaxID=3365654 RepID=UPI00378739DD